MRSIDLRRAAIALGLDVMSVLVFVAIGRRNHEETGAVRAVVDTAAPFLVGLAAGWLVARAWNRPDRLVGGLLIWPTTVLVGMFVRRVATDGGTAPAFVVVATVFLGVCLLGWRQAAGEIARRRLRSVTPG